MIKLCKAFLVSSELILSIKIILNNYYLKIIKKIIFKLYELCSIFKFSFLLLVFAFLSNSFFSRKNINSVTLNNANYSKQNNKNNKHYPIKLAYY